MRSIRLPLFVSIWFQVLFHSPHRGTFHLSLSELVHYRLDRVFSLFQWFGKLPTQFHFQRSTQEYNQQENSAFVYRTITFYGRPFQGYSTNKAFCKLLPGLTAPRYYILQPPNSNHSCKEQIDLLIYNADSEVSLYLLRFGLFPFRSPLLRESSSPARREIPCSLFLRLLRWFTSPGTPQIAMYSPFGTHALQKKILTKISKS